MHVGLLGLAALLWLLQCCSVQSSVSSWAADCCHAQDALECIANGIEEHYQSALDSIRNPPAEPSPLLVTYFTPGILSYSLYTYAINQMHADRHGWKLLAARPESGHEVDTNDQRWNKVHVLLQLLLSAASSEQVLIWVDSDLIVNHLDFSFASLLAQYPSADLIVSREVNPQNGLVNTGCMLIRNTAWAREFMTQWWTAYDRADGMDQHIFDRLYHHHPQLACAQHIALLPEEAINSRFPGLISYQNDQPVLHLAGESSFVRAAVFRAAWQLLCSAERPPADQPLVSRRMLDAVDYIGLHDREWSDIHMELSTAISPNASFLGKMRYKIREAQQSASKFLCTYSIVAEGQRSCTNIKELHRPQASAALQAVLQQYLALVHAELSNLIDSKECKLSQSQLGLLQGCLDAGLENLLVADIPDSRLALKHMDQLLDHYLFPHIYPSALPGATYYAFKVKEFSASLALKTADLPAGRTAYCQALALWRELHQEHGYFGSGNQLLNRYQEGILVGMRWMDLTCYLEGGDDAEIVMDVGFYVMYLIATEGKTDAAVFISALETVRQLEGVALSESSEIQLVKTVLPMIAVLRRLGQGDHNLLRALERVLQARCGSIHRCAKWMEGSICSSSTSAVLQGLMVIGTPSPDAQPVVAGQVKKMRKKKRKIS